MLVRIYWPNDSKRKVKLKRALFGDKWFNRDKIKIIQPKFKVRKVKKGIILIDDHEWDKLKNFLDELSVSYEILRETYLISGPLVLVYYGINAFNNSYFKVLANDEMLRRSIGKYVGLEDAVVTTFYKAINGKSSWLNYVIMGMLIRRLDLDYMIKTASEIGISSELLEFFGLIFTTLRGELNTNETKEIFKLVPKFIDIINYFNSLYWFDPPKIVKVEEFRGLTPKTVSGIASKQIFYY